jgi:hypothetical protein
MHRPAYNNIYEAYMSTWSWSTTTNNTELQTNIYVCKGVQQITSNSYSRIRPIFTFGENSKTALCCPILPSV